MTETTRALILKARKFVRSADMLRSSGDFDSAASRLYYAMFYCAIAALSVKGYAYASHKGVLSGFGQHLVKSGELPAELHRFLLDAYDQRQMGDYQPTSRLDGVDVAELQIKAESFIQLVEEWLQAREQS